MHKKFSRNQTLYGLRTNTSIKILYNVEKKEVICIEGMDDVDPDEIEISEREAFNIPYAIFIAGVPFYPSRYEFFTGDIYYHSRKPPIFRIELKDVGMLGKRAKTMNARITPDMLSAFDKPAKIRKRTLSQAKVMGASAKDKVQTLIEQGILNIPHNVNIQWHWCHLVAFSMLPEKRAQHTRNLVIGTSACNGHMANIEAATKSFIYEVNRPVSLEITAEIIADTHLATRIRYRVYEPKSSMLYTEYFDPLSDTLSDFADFGIMYEKIMEKFKGNTEQ